MEIMRITIKKLEEKIERINWLTKYKYDIKLFVTKGCGVDISINGEYQSTNSEKHLTNKEAYELLDEKFSKEIRQIIMSL